MPRLFSRPSRPCFPRSPAGATGERPRATLLPPKEERARVGGTAAEAAGRASLEALAASVGSFFRTGATIAPPIGPPTRRRARGGIRVAPPPAAATEWHVTG